jgi:hypothetical protein
LSSTEDCGGATSFTGHTSKRDIGARWTFIWARRATTICILCLSIIFRSTSLAQTSSYWEIIVIITAEATTLIRAWITLIIARSASVWVGNNILTGEAGSTWCWRCQVVSVCCRTSSTVRRIDVATDTIGNVASAVALLKGGWQQENHWYQERKTYHFNYKLNNISGNIYSILLSWIFIIIVTLNIFILPIKYSAKISINGLLFDHS